MSRRCQPPAECCTSGVPSPGAVRRLSAASPRVIALDVILADAGDPAETQELSDALGEAPNLVLCRELIDDPLRREDSRRRFPAERSISVTSMPIPMIAIRWNTPATIFLRMR